MLYFEEQLLDADWSLNAANWQWLSASAFFHQYYRVYSPIAFGKKTDKEGEFIKKYLPVLAKMPSKYIYEPWLAPKEVQKNVGCVIGKDYPAPIVDHAVISKENIQRMKASYAKNVSAKDKAKDKGKVDNPFADDKVTVKKSAKKSVKKEDVVKKETSLSASKKRKTPSSKISPKKQPKIDSTLKKLKIKEEKKYK